MNGIGGVAVGPLRFPYDVMTSKSPPDSSSPLVMFWAKVELESCHHVASCQRRTVDVLRSATPLAVNLAWSRRKPGNTPGPLGGFNYLVVNMVFSNW